MTLWSFKTIGLSLLFFAVVYACAVAVSGGPLQLRSTEGSQHRAQFQGIVRKTLREQRPDAGVVFLHDSVGFYKDDNDPADRAEPDLNGHLAKSLGGPNVIGFGVEGAFAPDFLGIAREIQRQRMRTGLAFVEVNLGSQFKWSDGPIYMVADRELSLADLRRLHRREPLSALALGAFYGLDRQKVFHRSLAQTVGGLATRLKAVWEGGRALEPAHPEGCEKVIQSLGPSRAEPGRLVQDLVVLGQVWQAQGGLPIFIISPMDMGAVEACSKLHAAEVDQAAAQTAGALAGAGFIVVDLHRKLSAGYVPGSLWHLRDPGRAWLAKEMADVAFHLRPR